MRRAALIVVLLLAFSVGGLAQLQTAPPLPNPGGQPSKPDVPWEVQQEHRELEKKANLQRQQDIKQDTEKLLELATELKQAVEKSNENTLSLDVIKKADQIEKLAKTVKDKMKGS